MEEKNMKKATIRDVAKAAGVSQSTVSRVLNNNGYVGEDARRRVEEAMGKRCIIRPALLQCVFPKAVLA